jgi:outer membrane lipopolysaccharide assembly protein LptE/RlpB
MKVVIPAKAGIQVLLTNSGFPITTSGMTAYEHVRSMNNKGRKKIGRIPGRIGEGKKRIMRYALRMVILSAVLFLGGCGYRIHPQSSLPENEIRIAQVENKTREPKLQDKLHRALTEEFMKQGVRVSSDAEHTLAVTISRFDMISMSEKKGVTVDYRVAVNVEVRVIDRSGKVVETRNVASPFIVSVTAAENLGDLLALKEAAEEQAMRDIAMEIAGALLYR